MRTLLLLLIFPLFANAQINRSATEFAKEQISEYITVKLFKGNPYQPVSYGELTEWQDKSLEIRWSIVHKFEITELQTNYDKKIAVQKLCKFIFYFDDRMKIIRAETSYHTN